MKKSIYLFSVALLGASLCPSSVFAGETSAVETPKVITEFVESQENNPPESTDAVKSPEQTESAETAIAPDVQNQTQETTTTNEVLPETAPEIPQEIASSEEPEENEPIESAEETQTYLAAAEQTLQAPAENENVDNVESTIQAAVPEAKTARAANVPLKDDHDGKIVDHGKANTDEAAKISSEYNFMPNFEKLEGIEVGGTNDFNEGASAFDFNLKNAKFNSITVTYKNVGTYNGKVIDMKVTVIDWNVFSGNPSRTQVSIHKTQGITMRGISDIRLNYAFLDRLTGKPVNLSGFFNFTDIDLKQSIDIFDNANVQNFYVTKDNVLYYKVHNGYIKIGDISGNNSNLSDMDHWLTYTYKNISSFDVRYNQEYETGAVFTYTYQAPVVIEEKPTVDPQAPDDNSKETKEPEELKEDSVTPIKDEPLSPVKVSVKEKAKLVQLIEQKPVFIATKLADKVAKPQTVAEARQLVQEKQVALPQTNEKKASIFTTLGGAGLVFLSGLFIVKKKKDQ